MLKNLAVFFIVSFAPISIANALPVLQLDADPGEYVGGVEESTMTSSPVFNLIALLDESKLSEPMANYQFFLSIALTPKDGYSGASVFDYGSFTIGGTTIDVSDASGDFQYGTPPVDVLSTSQDLASHGIYDTWYTEIGFTFSGTQVAAYNVQPGSLDQPNPGDMLYAETFAIDLSGLNLPEGGGLHFDLYGYTGLVLDQKGAQVPTNFIKAPPSHDAGTSIPEPKAVLLLGTALVGLVGLARKKNLK